MVALRELSCFQSGPGENRGYYPGVNMTYSTFRGFAKSAAVAAAGAVLLSGCGLIYKPVGHTLNHYSLDEVIPYTLGSGDLNKSSCGTGMGLAQLTGSFSRVINRPARLLVLVNTTAAFCSEAEAQKYHLLVKRNLHNDHTDVAQDNRIEAQRWERTTALRRYQAYKDTMLAYGKIGDGKCPDLRNEMGTNLDQLTYLVGVLTGVQGLLDDIQANSSVGIPQDIAAKAGRASQCMDNRKWWGVPKALEAVVWLSVPGNAPDGAKPWAQLRQSAAIGKADGIALSPMLYAVAAYGQSDEAKEKEAIKIVADTYNGKNVPGKYLLLNQIAYREAEYLSDQIWMAAKGHRTPLEALGTFPGDNSSSNSNFDAGALLN